MAVVTTDYLAGVMTNFRALWQDAFLAAQQTQIRTRIAMEIPSSTLTETHNWLGTPPVMREWVDERIAEGLDTFNYSLTNRHYEATLEVDRDTMEDDRIGIFVPRVQQMGMEAPRFQDQQVVEALVNGATTGNNSYDGVTFYNASHVVGSQAAQTNLYSGTGVTLAALQVDFAGAKAQMRRVKDSRGRPMGIIPDVVVAPPELEQVFSQMLNASFIPSGSVGSMQNTFVGQASLIISPYLTDVNDWHLLATNYPVKPLIFQLRKAPEYVAIDRIDDSFVFNFKKFRMGVDGRWIVGYGFWEMAVRVANT